MWCVCKQDTPKLEPFICLPLPSLKWIASSYSRALIKTSSDFCPWLVRRVGEVGESLLFILYLHPLALFGCGF